jgi:hypothetical protein
MSEVKFYLDENMDVEIAEQMSRHGVDIVTARDLGKLGETDEKHLGYASETGRILCTHDQDFLRLHAEGVPHAGIAFGAQYLATVGGWVRALRELHATTTAEDMVGQVQYLKVK